MGACAKVFLLALVLLTSLFVRMTIQWKGRVGALPDGAVLDPRGAKPPPLALAPRSGRLEGAVGLLDISKGGGKVFLDGIEAFLRTAFEGVDIRRYAKPTFSRNCPAGLLDDVAAACAHVVVGLAD